jgi:hypothetical protein
VIQFNKLTLFLTIMKKFIFASVAMFASGAFAQASGFDGFVSAGLGNP